MFRFPDKDECKVNPCKNSATCINLIGGFECKCLPGFQGDVCEQGTYLLMNLGIPVINFFKSNMSTHLICERDED